MKIINTFLRYKYTIIVVIILAGIGLLNVNRVERLQNHFLLKYEYNDRVLTAEEFRDIYYRRKSTQKFDYFLDVRTTKEVQQDIQKGVTFPKEVINIPHDEILRSPKILFEKYRITKDDRIFIFCNSGNRASQVVDILLENSYDSVFFTDTPAYQLIQQN